MVIKCPDFTVSQPEVEERIAANQGNRTKKFTARTIAGILRINTLTIFNDVLFVSLIALIAIHA